MPRSQHVVPSKGKWAVRRSGSAKVTRRFDTQEAAIREGKRLARNQSTELYIHGRNGRVREKESYGPDSFPPKG